MRIPGRQASGHRGGTMRALGGPECFGVSGVRCRWGTRGPCPCDAGAEHDAASGPSFTDSQPFISPDAQKKLTPREESVPRAPRRARGGALLRSWELRFVWLLGWFGFSHQRKLLLMSCLPKPKKLCTHLQSPLRDHVASPGEGV